MFSIPIPDHIDEMIMPNLYHWKKVKHLVNELGGQTAITNTTVETKLHAANFFLYLLSEASKHHGFEASFLRRIAFESMILNLNAAIESVAHMLNLIYGINIVQIKISIDHISKKTIKDTKRIELFV